MMQGSAVLLSDSGESSLRCPNCGSDYLHQGDVIVFRRGEDEPILRISRIEGQKAAESALIPSLSSDNPSARRQGLIIKFECEGCDAAPELLIAQHKGVEFVSWRWGDEV
jgi:hypothetical protein